MTGEGANTVEDRIPMRGGGTLTLRQEGPRIHMEAERPADGRGLYKAWLHGDQGGKLLLGTLAPEGGRLILRRTLSVGALERAGCWPQFWAESPLAFAFAAQGGGRWYCEQHPERMLGDPVLRGQLRGAMLCRREEDGFSLAVPFRTDSPVALSALFCLARVERWEGRAHLVWTFDSSGQPQIPHTWGEGRTD